VTKWIDSERHTNRSRATWSDTRNLRRLGKYLKPHRWQLTWLLLATVGATLAGMVVPVLIRGVVDGPIRNREPSALMWLGSLALVLGLVEAILLFLRRWAHAAAAFAMETALRCDIYRRLQRLSASFHDNWQIGQLLSRVTSDLALLRRFLAFGLVFAVVDVATFLAVVALLIWLHWPLGLLVAASAIPLLVIRKRLSHRHLSIARLLQDQQGDLTNLVEESARGMSVIRSFGQHHQMGERFSASARRVHDTAVGRSGILATSLSQFDLVPDATLALVLVAGAIEVSRGRLTLGSLAAFIALQTILAGPVRSLGWIIALGQEAMAAADRVFDILDARPAIADRKAAITVAAPTIRGRLRFDDVGFGYSENRAVLSGISFCAEPGERIAVVGATGSGKTTLVSLVPRLFDVTSGRITLDGRDLRDYTLRSLRAVVGMAFEDPTLFSMSVRENVTIGCPDATDDEVAEALAVAQAEFVYTLRWGLMTRIGSQGLTLSGGQRQRLALARAILGRPKVLVLDDPLSALDIRTETLVEATLATVLRDSTALIVAHRPSTVSLANRVVLLENGSIEAIGHHCQLMATVPAYAAILSAMVDQPQPVSPGPPNAGQPWR
jgi:ATP-binding cassette subfamily B protein